MILVKPFLYGLSCGVLMGAAGAFWISAGQNASQDLGLLKKSIEVARVKQADMDATATRYESRRESIERQLEAPTDDLETLLRDRADLRDVDLGAEWLCITDRAAGIAAPRCPAEPDAGVPAAAATAGQQSAGDAAGLSAAGEAVPDLPGATRGAGRSGRQAPEGSRATPPQTQPDH